MKRGWILLVLLFLAGTSLVFKDMKNYVLLRKEVERIEERCRFLKEENERLKKEIERLKKDKSYQEYVVKKELGWVRKDELILVIGEPERQAPSNASRAR